MVTVSIPFPGVIWISWCQLHERGWAVICVRSVFAGQASLSSCCICPAKQINFRLQVSDCCDSAWAVTMPISPGYPEKYFTAEEQVKHRWDLQLLESVTQSTKDLGELFCPWVNRNPEPRTERTSHSITHKRMKPRLRSHEGPYPTIQWITCCLTDSVSLNYCRKYVASKPFSTRTQEIQS